MYNDKIFEITGFKLKFLCEFVQRRSFQSLFVVITVFMVHSLPSAVFAGIEWKEYKSIQLRGVPKDVVVSRSGNWIYTLLNDNSIAVYSPSGTLFDKILIEDKLVSIEAGPSDEALIVTTEAKQIKVLSLDYIQSFHNEGAPFKGKIDAPVSIVVFMDFQ